MEFNTDSYPNPRDLIREIYGVWDYSACLHSHKYPRMSQAYFDALLPDALLPDACNGSRCFHSHSIERPDVPCNYLTPEDTVYCYYIFGDSVLHITHPYGQCPWKKL